MIFAHDPFQIKPKPCFPCAVSVNDPPVIANQSYSINEDEVLAVPASKGLLRGSSDVDNDTLVIVNNTSPANGNLTVQPDGSFAYVPKANFYGNDRFEFTVTDDQGAFVKGVVMITTGGSLLSSFAFGSARLIPTPVSGCKPTSVLGRTKP